MKNTTKLYGPTEVGCLMSIAAFISGGMHQKVNKLDNARESCDTGCLEFVGEAIRYSQYLEDLYQAAFDLTDGAPGVYEYAVCEDFGVWFMDEAIATGEFPCQVKAKEWLVARVAQFFTSDDEPRNPVITSALQAVEFALV